MEQDLLNIGSGRVVSGVPIRRKGTEDRKAHGTRKIEPGEELMRE